MRKLPFTDRRDGLIIDINSYNVFITREINEVQDCSDIWETYKIENPKFTDIEAWTRNIFTITVEYRYFNNIIAVFHSDFIISRVGEKIQMNRDIWNCFGLARELVIEEINLNQAKGKNGLLINLPHVRVSL